MIQPISLAQIQQLQLQLVQARQLPPEQAAQQLSGIYSTLENAGYAYAGWAKGVANADTVAGISAIDYLKGTALMGLGSWQCQNLSSETLGSIKLGMAEQYLLTLKTIAESSPTQTAERDINAAEGWGIHRLVLQNHNLGIENWTLDAPFRVLQAMGGDQAVEAYWTSMRETGGSGPFAMIGNIKTLWMMLEAAQKADDPDTRSLAKQWLSNVPGFSNREQWSRSFDVMDKWLGTQLWNDTDRAIARTVCTTFFGACAAPRSDPLTLDLDGDGIETNGISVTAPVMFDISGTGIQQSVGWIKPDDGFLVRDLNGNGLIDSGAELFGDATTLANGQTAADGFAA